MISKNEYRKLAKEKRLLINNKEKYDQKIYEFVLNNNKIKKCSNILMYVSKNDEVDTFNLINYFLKIGKNVYLPRINGLKMDFFRVNNLDNLKINKFNILEPVSNIKYYNKKLDIIIVPGLLFDKTGNRIGYGKGYYDAYLKNKNFYKIGLCYHEFLFENICYNINDIKMNLIITDEGLWNLKD